MEQIPDAPWIREAERDGYPTGDEIECPICGASCSSVYYSTTNWKEIIACNKCLVEWDAYEWKEEQKENDKP